MNSTNTKKSNAWEYIFYSIVFIGSLTFLAFIIHESDKNQRDMQLIKLQQAREMNETINMLVSVAYKNDTTRFNEYQKGILKAVISNDVRLGLTRLAPHHKHKLLEAGDAVLKAFEESPENPLKP